MDLRELQSIREAYDDYAAEFRTADRAVQAMLDLKYEHSVRVSADARAIASELSWPDDEVRLAECAGLLHDIGRFQQFTRFRTFLDQKSVDHGECGQHALLRSQVINACPAGDRQVLLDAVRFHNRRHIPANLPERHTNMLKLVRDADKVDIYFVVNETILGQKHEQFPEILLGIDVDGPVSRELVREIREHRTASYEHVKSLADIGLIRMVWVYNINFLPSLRRITERRLLEDIRKTIPSDDADCRAIMDDVDKYIADSLVKGRLGLA